MNVPSDPTPTQTEYRGVFIPLEPSGGSRPRADLLAVLAMLSQYKLVLFAAFLLAAIAAFALALWVEPRYRAEIVVMPTTLDGGPQLQLGSMLGNLGGLASLAGLNLGGGTSGDWREQNIAFLSSRAYGQRFIEKHDLMPELYPDDWDAQSGEWTLPPEHQPTLWDAYNRFDGSVRELEVDDVTGLITVSLTWTDREKVTRWANALIRDANELIRERDVEEARRSIEYLEREASATNVIELRQAIYRLMQDQINKVMLANVRAEYAFRVVDPAFTPDEDDQFWPNRPMFALTGGFAGVMLAVSVLLMRRRRRARRARRAEA